MKISRPNPVAGSYELVGAAEPASKAHSVGDISPSIKLETKYLQQLPLLLGKDKYTFIFDIDETLIMWKQSKQERPTLYPELLDSHTSRFYPSSPALPFALETLNACKQNIGLVTNGTRLPSHLASLKTFGVDLNHISFIAVPDIRGTDLNASYDKTVSNLNSLFQVKGFQPITFEQFLGYLESKYNLKIIHFPANIEDITEVQSYKSDAIEEVYKISGSSPRLEEMLRCPLIAIGNKEDDVLLAYPESYYKSFICESNGLGIVLVDKFGHFNNGERTAHSREKQDFYKYHGVHLLGRVLCTSVAHAQTGDLEALIHRINFLEEFAQLGLRSEETNLASTNSTGAKFNTRVHYLQTLNINEYIQFCNEVTSKR